MPASSSAGQAGSVDCLTVLWIDALVLLERTPEVDVGAVRGCSHARAATASRAACWGVRRLRPARDTAFARSLRPVRARGRPPRRRPAPPLSVAGCSDRPGRAVHAALSAVCCRQRAQPGRRDGRWLRCRRRGAHSGCLAAGLRDQSPTGRRFRRPTAVPVGPVGLPASRHAPILGWRYDTGRARRGGRPDRRCGSATSCRAPTRHAASSHGPR